MLNWPTRRFEIFELRTKFVKPKWKQAEVAHFWLKVVEEINCWLDEQKGVGAKGYVQPGLDIGKVVSIDYETFANCPLKICVWLETDI